MPTEEAPYDRLVSPHGHSINNRNEIEASGQCGCFYCCAIYRPSEIEDWHEETIGPISEQPDPFTAMCPRCGIDSLIGDRAGFELSVEFLSAMHERWF
jgi:hypothetical protein